MQRNTEYQKLKMWVSIKHFFLNFSLLTVNPLNKKKKNHDVAYNICKIKYVTMVAHNMSWRNGSLLL